MSDLKQKEQSTPEEPIRLYKITASDLETPDLITEIQAKKYSGLIFKAGLPIDKVITIIKTIPPSSNFMWEIRDEFTPDELRRILPNLPAPNRRVELRLTTPEIFNAVTTYLLPSNWLSTNEDPVQKINNKNRWLDNKDNIITLSFPGLTETESVTEEEDILPDIASTTRNLVIKDTKFREITEANARAYAELLKIDRLPLFTFHPSLSKKTASSFIELMPEDAMWLIRDNCNLKDLPDIIKKMPAENRIARVPLSPSNILSLVMDSLPDGNFILNERLIELTNAQLLQKRGAAWINPDDKTTWIFTSDFLDKKNIRDSKKEPPLPFKNQAPTIPEKKSTAPTYPTTQIPPSQPGPTIAESELKLATLRQKLVNNYRHLQNSDFKKAILRENLDWLTKAMTEIKQAKSTDPAKIADTKQLETLASELVKLGSYPPKLQEKYRGDYKLGITFKFNLTQTAPKDEQTEQQAPSLKGPL